jgi:glutamine amidotransferase
MANSQTIAVIDYGMGNLHSAASALRHVAPDAEVVITNDKQAIANADRVVFPGVGAIRDCVAEIRRLQFDQSVAETIESGKPILAICIGMQALMQHSDENAGVDCLGHFKGKVKFFGANATFCTARDEGSQSGEHLKVPHMGWNQVKQEDEHPLWHNIANESRFYFVHSYYVEPEDDNVVSGRAHYGFDFCAALARDNLFAVQFHPEKSHSSGLQLLKNFVSWKS